MLNIGFWSSVKREVRTMSSRGSYLVMMIIVPVLMCLFFIYLLSPGLPLKVPTAIVDLDNSPMSRSMIRSLSATEFIKISEYCESYDQAMEEIRKGNIYGFFIIPSEFERDAISGRTPSLEYYNNLTYFVPGTLTFKGFKTIAVTTTAGVIKTKLVSSGASEETVGGMLQPLSIQNHPIGNPWMSYSVYLSPSFTFGTLALLIMIMTVFGITTEIKYGTSRGWLATARGSICVAVSGKLLPQFAIWSAVGQLCLALLFRYGGLPCADITVMMLAMELFILASQALGLFICCLLPNPRLAFSVVCLFGILSFSFTGFSFPVQDMYGAIAIFSYLAPVRYIFLIYINSALNAFPLYYARMSFVALLIFPLIGATMLWRLKRACLNPVYVP